MQFLIPIIISLAAIVASFNVPAHWFDVYRLFPEKEKLLFNISSPVAPAIVGIASKKENSTAVFLFAPKNNAPTIVAAARETPGITEND